MDECATSLSEECRDWFKQMGSTEMARLTYRCGFAFIGIKGKQDAVEKRAPRIQTSDEVSVSQIFAVKIKPLSTGEKEDTFEMKNIFSSIKDIKDGKGPESKPAN